MLKKIPTSCVELLQRMVGYETVNSSISDRPDAERELALDLETLAQEWGLTTRRMSVDGESFNLLISHKVSDDAGWLLFESHMDTVSIEGMTIDPLGGKIENGRLYGRGACDTKGTGAAMFWALKQYASSGVHANNVALVFTVDEEISKRGVRKLVEHLPQLGWKPFGAIVGEPTDLTPVVAHNGVVRWTIRTRGIAAHSSDPSHGRSAISMMAKVIQAIERNYIAKLEISHPLVGKAQCSINKISGGVQVNIIPEHCEILLDRRVVPGEDATCVLPEVEKVLEQLRREDPTMDVSQDEPYLSGPLDPKGSDVFCRSVAEVLGKIGLSTTLAGAKYGTDASNLGEVGVPSIVLGPGSITQAHTKDEWIEVAELSRGAEVYQALMASSTLKSK